MIKLIKAIIAKVDAATQYAADMGVQPIETLKFQED